MRSRLPPYEPCALIGLLIYTSSILLAIIVTISAAERTFNTGRIFERGHMDDSPHHGWFLDGQPDDRVSGQVSF